MKITKYLCKKFDRESKGYVTVEDIFDVTITTIFDNIIWIFIVAFIIIFLSSIFNLIGSLFFRVDEYSIKNIVAGFIIVLFLVVLIIVTDFICKKIGKIKVVKCSMKEAK